MSTLSTVRRSIHPEEGDSWESIAARELDRADEAVISQLQSWNMHVFMRPASPKDSPRQGNPVLPSDIIFLEPPQAAG